MKKEVIKNEEGTEITVLIELKKRTLARHPRMTFTTRMVKTMLENDKISVDKCILSDTIDNNNDVSKRSGKWIFSVKNENIRKIVTETESLYSDRSIDVLDNIPTTPPKTTKKRTSKKRITTKKGS